MVMRLRPLLILLLAVGALVGTLVLLSRSYSVIILHTTSAQTLSPQNVVELSTATKGYSKAGSTKKASLYDPLYHDRLLLLSASNSSAHKPACRIPQLDPWDPQMLPYFTKLFKVKADPPLTCNGKRPPLTYIWNRTHVRINESNARFYNHKNIAKSCQIGLFARDRDDDLIWSESFKLSVGTGYKLPSLEQYIMVRCGPRSKKNSWVYSRVHLRLAANPVVKRKVKKQKRRPRRRLSVLLFIVDGISHVMGRRVLNNTFYYLLNEQKAITLHGHHTVGMNTFPNMIPFMTGHHIEELSSYKNKAFDRLDWPLLWKNYSKNDYITAYSEDTKYSTFNYHKKGFIEQPTDYYFKNYINYIEYLGSCSVTGGHVHRVMLDVLEDFLHLHKDNEYFFWHFMNALCHQTFEPLAAIDDEYQRYFKRHFQQGTFNNTLVILASDHGNRFSGIRKTSTGRIEERLPLQMLVFPEWFRREYKDLYRVLQKNAAEALTTPFDMHETLLDVMAAITRPRNYNKRLIKRKLKRGTSLFREIPLSRTCKDAGIPYNFCICRNTKPIPHNSSIVLAATEAAIKHLNSLLRSYIHKCRLWSLVSVLSAQVATGKAKLFNIKQEYSDYIVVFEANPVKAGFEAIVRKFKGSNNLTVQGSILRISLYGNTANCMNDVSLKNYCYCKKQKKLRNG